MMTGGAFTIRPFGLMDAEVDVARVVGLMEAVEAVDHDGEDWGVEVVRRMLALPGLEPMRMCWLAVSASEEGEELYGWGFAWLAPGEGMATLSGATHPLWRGRGVGTALLKRALDAARLGGARDVGVYAGVGNAGAEAFLRRRGFAPVATNTLLRWTGAALLAEGALPQGYRIETFADAPDAAVFEEAVNRCFAGQWGHHQVTAAVVAEWLPTLDWGGIFVARGPDGAVAGMTRAERYGELVGYVDAPGVAVEHRGSGVYGPLALAALRWLREGGASVVEMESWGDRPETLRLYEALGFVVARQAVAYERAL